MAEPWGEERNDSRNAAHIAPLPSRFDTSKPQDSSENRFKSQGASSALRGNGTTGSKFHAEIPSTTINDVPLELIICILNTALDQEVNELYYEEDGDYLSRLKDLATVCATWKSIIQSTPTFWTVIESTITPNEMAYMLRKSEKCNIAFKHLIDHDQDIPASERFDFLGIVGSNMNRCSSLSVRVERGHQAERILESRAPNLRQAIIYAAYCDFSRCLNLFDGQTEVLEELELGRIPIQWDLGLPPTLRRLQLSYDVALIERLPRPSRVISALSSCTGIEILRLNCGDMFFGESDWVDKEVPPLELPKLKELKLENLTMGGSRYILGSLRAPALQNLELDERLDMGFVSTLLRPPSPILIEAIRRTLPLSKSCSITIESSNVALDILGEKTGVSLALRCVDPDEFSLWLAEVLASEQASTPETRLRVSHRPFGSQSQSFQKLVNALPNVVRLVCRDINTEVVEILMHYLASPYQANDGLRWHWAGLRHIEFSSAWKWPDLFLAMVRERYGQREQEFLSDDISKRYPSSLTTLWIGPMESKHPETLQEIKDIVGKEVLGEDDSDAGN